MDRRSRTFAGKEENTGDDSTGCVRPEGKAEMPDAGIESSNKPNAKGGWTRSRIPGFIQAILNGS